MAQPQGPMAGTPQKPSKTGIIWAIVIFLVTAVVGIAMIVGAFVVAGRALNDFQRIEAGETQKVTLSSGNQYVFVIADSRRDLQEVTVSITDSNGDPVQLQSGTDINANSSSGGGIADTLGYIDVKGGSATYTVAVEGPPRSRVRIGELPIGTFFGLLFGGIVIGGLGFVVALVILIIALVRRSKVKKANRAAAAPPAPPVPAAPAPLAPPAPAAPPAPPAPEPSGEAPPPPPPPGPTDPT